MVFPLFEVEKGAILMNNRNLEFRNAFGGITNFLTKYFGYVLVKDGVNKSLYCPNHADSENNRKGINCHSNDTNDTWFCYSCANEGSHIAHGGSYIAAVMENKNMSKAEAVRWLCKEAGIENKATEYSVKDIREMFVMECHRNLIAKMNETEEFNAAAKYLANRGFIMRTLRKFGVGYSNSEELKTLRQKGISQEMLVKAGILRTSKKGRIYNAFRGRIVMMVGENIYGRAVSSESGLKHLYTMGGNTVFNKTAALAKKRDILFVVESAFDALTINQFIERLGMNWAVIATCGTHGIRDADLVEFVKDASPVETIIIPDCDPWVNESGRRHMAGQTAGLEKAKKFALKELPVRLLVLPPNSDPNDLSKNKVGAGKFKEMVLRAMPPVKYELFCEAHYYDLKDFGGKSGFLEKAKAIIANHYLVMRSEVIIYLVQLTKLPIGEVEDFFTNAVKQSAVCEYFRRCRAKGLTDEMILNHIQGLLKK